MSFWSSVRTNFLDVRVSLGGAWVGGGIKAWGGTLGYQGIIGVALALLLFALTQYLGSYNSGADKESGKPDVAETSVVGEDQSAGNTESPGQEEDVPTEPTAIAHAASVEPTDVEPSLDVIEYIEQEYASIARTPFRRAMSEPLGARERVHAALSTSASPLARTPGRVRRWCVPDNVKPPAAATAAAAVASSARSDNAEETVEPADRDTSADDTAPVRARAPTGVRRAKTTVRAPAAPCPSILEEDPERC